MNHPSDYLVVLDPREHLEAAAERSADLVFRTDISRPGFALLDLGPGLTPTAFRALLIDFCAALDRAYRRRFGRRVVLLSANRFDQQVTTEAHRDGGPDESVLVLGYEPTEVESRLFLIDSTRRAIERGMTPKEFLARDNPMSRPSGELLAPYTTEVVGFAAGHYRIVVINNGSLGYDQRERGMLGVLHKATVTPRPDRTRPVDSIMLHVVGADESSEIPSDALREFIETGTYFAA